MEPSLVPKYEDFLDLLEKEKGRWVSQDDFLDHNINANRLKFTRRTLLKYRETRYVVWSKKNPAIGMDRVGNFLERSGNEPRNYRYRYFLLREYDKQQQQPSYIHKSGIGSNPRPLKENVAASEPVTRTSQNAAPSPTQTTTKRKPSRPIGKKDSTSEKDATKTKLANDTKSDSEPVKAEKPKTTRRNTPARIEDVKKLVEMYWKKVINGDLVTQKDVALQKFPNEPNILSKKVAKPYMKKISEAVKLAVAEHQSIRNFNDRVRAGLLTFIHDTLK
jgi:hypothetical protein